jgi:hypothetical protein
MGVIEEVLKSKLKPKEKQTILVEAITQNKVSVKEFISFFESASDVDKGTCADIMKHVSAENPELLSPYIDVLVKYINYKAARVKWGVPEAIGNLAKKYPKQVTKAIPNLLLNTDINKINTTVIKWCSAYALVEIAKYNPKTRKQLVPVFLEIIRNEENNGVKNVYIKAIKIIEKGKL